jgi:putative transposase
MAKRQLNKLRMYAHFVWATRDRLPLLTADIERAVYRYIESVCKEAGCEVFAINGMPDHVHVFVTLPGTIGYSDLVKNMKAGSSRLVSKELKPGEWFAWQHHYGAFSMRKKDIASVTEYIRNQKQHHADSSLWPEAEATHDEMAMEEDE